MARGVCASWWNQIAVRAFRGLGGMGIPGYPFPKCGKPRGRPRVGANAGLHRPSIFHRRCDVRLGAARYMALRGQFRCARARC